MLLFGDSSRGHAYQRVEIQQFLKNWHLIEFPGLAFIIISDFWYCWLHSYSYFYKANCMLFCGLRSFLCAVVIHLNSHSSVSLYGVAMDVVCLQIHCYPCTSGTKEGEYWEWLNQVLWRLPQISGASLERSGFYTHRFHLGRNIWFRILVLTLLT